MRSLSIEQARRVALAAQGFTDQPPASSVTKRHFRRVLERMNVVQLDSVNAFSRSHYLPFFARLGPYDRDVLDDWLWRSGENFEFLAHEASITPAETVPWLRWKMAQSRWKVGVQLEAEQPDYLAAVHAQVAESGPHSVRTLRDPGTRGGTWWQWPKGKVALERLYTTGRLAIAYRDTQFTTHYDLPTRVLPTEPWNAAPVDEADALVELVARAARSHGVATVADLADYFRLGISRTRPALAALIERGVVEPVRIEGWQEPAYMPTGTRVPRAVNTVTILSPFDPVVWFRPRAERLFGFNYRIEIYVPAAKRRYGYYVLPVLLDDRLAGRVDLKSDRGSGRLVVQGSWAEDHADHEELAVRLYPHLGDVAAWLGLDEVVIAQRGDLASALHAVSRLV